MQAFGGAAFAEETDWRLGDFAAVALWLLPGVEPDNDATLAKLTASVAAERFKDLLAVFGLMRQCLESLDEDHLATYLDSTNPRNIPFYERHGFEVTTESRAGASPPIVSMLRSPR